MSGSAPSLFVFRLPGTEPSGPSTYSCLASSIEEAQSRAFAMGHHRAELIDQRGVETIDPAALDGRIRTTIGLGPEWISLVDVLDVVMGRLTFGPFWTLHVYGEAYGYDPNETPGMQAMQLRDGSLELEITGLHSPNLDRLPPGLGAWTVVPASEPTADGPFIPRMSRHYEPGWQQRSVAVDGLTVLTNGYGITNRDFFMFGEQIAEEVDALGLLERAGEGPQFRIRDALIQAAGRQPEVAPEACRPSLPNESTLEAFELAASRITRWDEQDLTRRNIRGRWSVDPALMERAEVAVQQVGGEYLVGKIWRHLAPHVRGVSSRAMLRAATTALVAREALPADEYTALTTGFATSIGKVHPDDRDRIDEWWGPSGADVRAFYDQVEALTPRQRLLIDLNVETMADGWDWDEMRAEAKGRLLAARRNLPYPLEYAFDAEVDDPIADALLGLVAISVAGEDKEFLQRVAIDLTAPFGFAMGWVGTEQLIGPGEDAGPQDGLVRGLIERMRSLDESEVAALAVVENESLAGARIAAWTEAKSDVREGPWIRAAELPIQAAADAADALVVRDWVFDPPDSNGPGWFTREHYELLTEPWRRVIGPIHPDDADIRPRGAQAVVDPEVFAVPADAGSEDQLFPWLRSALARNGWVGAELQGGMQASTIATVVLMSLETWALGDLFAALPERAWPTSASLPVRLGNRLASEDLRALSPRDLLLMRNVGATSVERLLVDLVERTRSVAEHGAPELLDEVSADPIEAEPVGRPMIDPSVGLDLLRLTEWAVLTGATERPLLTPSGTAEPAEVLEARARLLAVTTSIVDLPGGVQRLSDVLTAHVEALDDRVIQILSARLFSRDPLTLDRLGEQFGVTRERIRQLEGSGRSRLWDTITNDPRLADVMRAIVAGLPPVSSLAGVLEWMPALADEVGGLGEPAWFVLDRLDDTWEVQDGWIGTPSIQAARDATVELLSAVADSHGLVDLQELVASPGALEALDPFELESWLIACGFAVHGAHLLMRSRGLLDWSEALLAIAGEPRTAEELIELIPLDRSVRSLKNALSDDERFVAVDRERWALADWGMAEYGSLRHQIGLAVDASDDGVPLAELVASLTARFNVAAGSVVAYATTGEFAVVEGVVRRAAFRIAKPKKSAAMTRRLYRSPWGWVFRVQVNTDHLRGSGFPIPIALFSEVRRSEGDRRVEFQTDDGVLPLIWNGTQAACGSIRRFLLHLDAAVGAEALLFFNDDGTFDLRLARLEEEDPLATALQLIGHLDSVDFKEALGDIGQAIGRTAASWQQIVRSLEERDDLDVADVIRAALIERGMSASTSSRPSSPWD